MKILIGCECSGNVRQAFRDLDHEAWSCDLGPAWDGSPYHIQGDIFDAMASWDWDMLIAHPPCTYLANSGVRWLHTQPGRWQLMEEGAAFFKRVYEYNRIPLRCLENPVMHGHAMRRVGVKWSQTFQPWHFGHEACKRTCLWLVGLPLLVPTEIVGPPPIQMTREERAKWHAVHLAAPSEHRQADRAVTFEGVASAMACQWGTQ